MGPRPGPILRVASEGPLRSVGSGRTDRRERILSMNRMNFNGELGLADTEDVATSVSDSSRYAEPPPRPGPRQP